MSDILSVLAKPKKLLNTFMVAGFESVETGNSIGATALCDSWDRSLPTFEDDGTKGFRSPKFLLFDC